MSAFKFRIDSEQNMTYQNLKSISKIRKIKAAPYNKFNVHHGCMNFNHKYTPEIPELVQPRLLGPMADDVITPGSIGGIGSLVYIICDFNTDVLAQKCLYSFIYLFYLFIYFF